MPPKPRRHQARWLISFLLACQPLAAQVVSIPDPNLANAVESALGKTRGPLSPQDLLGLTNLVAGVRGITNLTGLNWALNLKLSALGGNAISDAGALGGVWQLQSLLLYNNAIADLTPLRALTNWSCLEVRWNAFTNLSPLGTPTQRASLYAGGNTLADLSPLANLSTLSLLNLDHGGVRNISPLLPLTNLTGLDLSYNPITNLAAASAWGSLTNLFLSGIGITNTAFLTNFSRLAALTLFSNAIADLAPLRSLPTLTSLNLGRNPISDPTPLCTLTNLQYLWLSEAGLTNLGFVPRLPKLRYLHAAGNQLSDTTLLSGPATLKFLDLSHNPLTNLTGLAKLSQLTFLNLDGSLISAASTSLTNLTGLTNLIRLSAKNDRLTDLSALASLPRLQWVDLRTNVLDLRPNSAALLAIQTLTNRGVTVLVTPQAQPPVFALGPWPPTISLFSTWAIPANGSASFAFSVSDNATPAGLLQVNVSSSNPLLPNSSISVAGTDANRTLTLTPGNGQGSALVTVTVTDSAGLSTNFVIRVNVLAPVTVPIPDPNLNAAVRLALAKPTGDLTSVDLQSLTLLDAYNSAIASLAGLEWCTNLLELSLQANAITNLNNLAGLARLRVLNLGDDKLSSLAPLGGLTNLVGLYLDQNRLTDVSVVTNFPHLSYLDARLNLLDTTNDTTLQFLRGRPTTVVDLPQRQPPLIDVPTNWVVAIGTNSSLPFDVLDNGPGDQTFSFGVSPIYSNWFPVLAPVPGLSSNSQWTLQVTAPPKPGLVNFLALNATNDVGLFSSQLIRVVAAEFLPVNGALLRDHGLTWSSSGDAPWFGQYLVTRDGHASAQSGVIANNQRSRLQATFAGPGRLSFWWKVSSQSGYDQLDFSLGSQTNRLTGEVDWQQVVRYVPAGPQTATWLYEKSGTTSSGLDAAWVDAVTYEPGSWLELIGGQTNGQQRLGLHGVPGRLYELQGTTDPTKGPAAPYWFRFVPLWVANQSALVFTDSNATPGLRLYRLHDLTPWLEPPVLQADGTIRVVTHDPPVLGFSLLVSTDLTNWSTLASATNPLSVITNIDLPAANSPQRFYRAVLRP